MRFAPLLAAAALLAPILAEATPAAAGGIEFGPVHDAPKVKPQKKKAPAVQTAPAPLPGDTPEAETAATVPPAAAPPPEAPPSAATPAAVQTPAVPQASGAGRVSTKGIPPPPAPRNCKTTWTYESWLRDFKQEAAAEGISPRVINATLAGMTPDQSVISRDRRQGFFAQSFLDFSAKLATPNRVQNGRAQIEQNRATFDRAVKEFGVHPAVITGFWALESDFGAGMGKLPIMRSLLTLAYDCRRGPRFRDELKAALRIIERGDMTPSTMIGSWAGEIGQTQFLPTRYLEHAIDYDGDGRPDLFANPTDIIGTTANYMVHLGWRANEPWIEEVRVPAEMPWDQSDLTIKHPRSQWAAWGVTKRDGEPLDNDALAASLLLPMGRFGPAFLAYPNFDVYLQWNQSLNYATTAAYLATRIDGAPAMRRGREGIPFLSIDEAKELQRLLTARGYDVGEIDGLIGLKSRQAIKAMQLKFKLPADSYPTPELLSALRRG
ncbi:lytic murein transglycosylase [Hyphomicrobium sp.]|uniref:lytic murein transglycosylase n=1 Tax=Hyphomicrobium sp. TaxID=82 RepID=UPI0025BF23F5|nr:lytic murein transglycosylase [Hyphomicrobium sp.]MCC7251247.1 lytic murein transglycosylase [Hyphomicrobium sp.]